MRLGSFIESVLAKVGITQERVERFLGRPCNCPVYIDNLNRVGAWARQAVKDVARADGWFRDMAGEDR